MQRVRAILLGAILLIVTTAMGQQRPMPPYQMGILRHAAIQRELKLTPAQKRDVIAALNAAVRDFQYVSHHGASMADYDRVYAEQLKALGSMSEPQKARLRQISLQMIGSFALTDPAVAKRLGVSEQQRRKIQTALGKQAERSESQMQARIKALGKTTPAQSLAARKKILGEQHLETTRLGESMLTPRQRSRWRAMLGRPFDLDLLTPQPQRSPD